MSKNDLKIAALQALILEKNDCIKEAKKYQRAETAKAFIENWNYPEKMDTLTFRTPRTVRTELESDIHLKNESGPYCTTLP